MLTETDYLAAQMTRAERLLAHTAALPEWLRQEQAALREWQAVLVEIAGATTQIAVAPDHLTRLAVRRLRAYTALCAARRATEATLALADSVEADLLRGARLTARGGDV